MASAQEIDRHYKNYLQARYQNVGTSSFAYLFRYAFLWAGVWLGSITLTDFFSAPDGHIFWTAAGAVVIALTCIWPILQLRERSLRTVAQTPPPAASSSLISLILRPFAGPPTRRIVAWYSVISVVSTVTFSLLWEARHTEVDLGLFKSTVHFPHHLNERIVFLLIGNLCFAAFLGLWDVYTGRWNQPKWARDGETRGMRFEREVSRIVYSVPLMACGFVALFTTSWLVGRTQITRWIIQLSAGVLRPFLIRFARYRFDVGPGLVFRLITLCINTGVILRLPKVFFDVNASQPLNFAPLTSKMKGTDAEKYLTTALFTTDDYLLNFTAFEWADRSHQSSKRKALLEDLSTKPTAWNNLWAGLSSQIDKSLRILQTRNGKLVSSAPSQPVTAPPSIPTLSANKDRAPAVRSLAAPGVVKQVDAATDKAEQAALTVSNAVSSSWTAAQPTLNTLVKRTTAAISPYTDNLVENNPTALAVLKRAEDLKTGVQGVQQQIQTLQGKAVSANEKAKSTLSTLESKTWWRRQWNENKESWKSKNWACAMGVRAGDGVERAFARRWAEEEVEGVLPRRRVDLGLIRTLSAFIAGSYDEDPYGQVQQNVPTALSSFAAYHSALQGFINELKNQAGETESKIWEEEVGRVIEETIDPVRLAIENGVRRIEATFGKSMKAFGLSAGVTSWIEGIVREGQGDLR